MKNLIINGKYQIDIVDVNRIMYLKSDNTYTEITATDGASYVMSKSLKTVSESLGASFIRVSQSYLLNMAYISNINKKDKVITMKDDTQIKFTVSTRRILELLV